jgi:predicted ATPase
LRKTKGPRYDGHFQDYVAGIVASWKSAGKEDERLARLGKALQDLGLTWKVEAKPLDATRVEIVVGRLKNAKRGGAKDMVNIADVGFGVSQILPALVALEVALPGQLVHLEQPEIHLHPKAQRSLAKLLAEAAIKEKRLVVETHSSILIRGIQTLVARGELDPQLVKLHWFTRDEETGATRVTSADLDGNGAFGSDWPEDFDDTYLESERDYLDAVEARMK